MIKAAQAGTFPPAQHSHPAEPPIKEIRHARRSLHHPRRNRPPVDLLLQINARESVATLARHLGIARTTVNSRLERLEKGKIITGYGVRLGQRMRGGLQAYVGIKAQPRSGKDIVRRLSAMGQVQQLCAVSGEFDYVAWLSSDSPEQLDQLLDQIGSLEGVEKPRLPSFSAARSTGANRADHSAS